MSTLVLVINAGSSSLKYQLIDVASELTLVKDRYNTLRLHAGIGYVTPEDEHLGRGE